MRLEKVLLKMAAREGACVSGLNKLAGMTDRRDMVNLYLANLDFCLPNNFPDNAFVLANFGNIINDMGIFLDDGVNVRNRAEIVLLGASRGKVEVDGYHVSEIFIKHNSVITIEASGHSFVMVDVFDDAILDITSRDRSMVCVNHHGGDVSWKATEDARVKVREKKK